MDIDLLNGVYFKVNVGIGYVYGYPKRWLPCRHHFVTINLKCINLTILSLFEFIQLQLSIN
jgi:hypothetical protein